MGMYAGYYRISDAELEQLRQLEERAARFYSKSN